MLSLGSIGSDSQDIPSFAFILGCVPPAVPGGAGAIAREVTGSAVIGGMLAATGIAIFLIPMMFYVVEKISKAREGRESKEEQNSKRIPGKGLWNYTRGKEPPRAVRHSFHWWAISHPGARRGRRERE